METIKNDVTIIGAGVTGLMLSQKLSGLGLKVALVEKNCCVAKGPSTRNEGWLHNGTYHATSIGERDSAIQIARRCIYGHNQIRNFAPEAIEDPDLPSIALLKDEEKYSEVISRWEEANVPYKEISLSHLKRVVPEINLNYICNAFEVQDVGINTRILYSKLLQMSITNGVNVFKSANIKFNDERVAHIRKIEDEFKLESRLYIYTSGYSNKTIFQDNFDLDIPMRYWKSHLINTPRVSEVGTFFLDPNEVGMMHHDLVSVIGFNEDAVELTAPDFEIIPEKIKALIKKFQSAFHLDEDLRYFPVACIKVDVPKKLNISRSLNISVIEPIENHICAFPGKMTEAPYLTDFLVKFLHGRLLKNTKNVAFRPLDSMKNELLCKQGVKFEEKSVVKKQESFRDGHLEERIANLFASSKVRRISIPRYYGTVMREGEICSIIERLNGKDLLGNSDLKVAEELVKDLALFHEMFSQNPEVDSSSVVYRDAIKSNFILSEDNMIYNIDFSSSNRFVHCFDDLALLLNPAWGKLPSKIISDLKEIYLENRKEFRKKEFGD